MIKIYKYGEVSSDDIFARNNPTADVSGVVREIVENVKENGDKALYEYSERFDGAVLTSLEVTKEEIEEAYSLVEPEFIRILKAAAENIREFHSAQKRNSFIINNKKGIVTGQKVVPIERQVFMFPEERQLTLQLF